MTVKLAVKLRSDEFVFLLIESPHPLQVFIFDHLELDMTQLVSFQGGGQLSLHEAAVTHDDQICEFCGRQTHQHVLLLSF